MSNTQAEQKVDYDIVRSLVRDAFSYNDAPSNQWPLADHMTNRFYQPEKRRRRDLSPEEREAYRVHATESRRTGYSREPMGEVDMAGRWMRGRIRSSSPEIYVVLDYFYNHNTIAAKRAVKNMVWRIYLPAIKGSPVDTKALTCMILDELLPCYRDKMLKGKDYPANPRSMFKTISPSMWKQTYRKHWNGLEVAIIALDEQALEAVR